MRALDIAMVAACPFPANRGTPSRISGMAEALARRGHRIDVVTYHFGLDVATHGFEIHRTPWVPYRYLGPGPTVTKLALLDPLLLGRLFGVLRQRPFDLIHAHHFEGALVAYAARALTGLRVVYDAHTTLDSELGTYRFPAHRRLSRLLDRKVPEWADHTIGVSETLKEELLGHGLPEERVDVVATGANLSQMVSGGGPAIRKEYGLDGRPVVMYTGALDAFQQVELLIDAMVTVAREEPDAVLVLVVGIDRPEIRARCVERGISDRVRIAVEPVFERVPAYLAAADVAVLPRTECSGIPQKLVNYMASGKAIVSFAGSAKLLVDEDNGLVVPNGDVGSMAASIVRLLRDPSLRARLGERAAETVAGRYDWDDLARRLEAIYARLVG